MGHSMVAGRRGARRALCLVVALVAVVGVSAAGAAAGWLGVAPLPTPRGLLAVAARDGVVYAAGGSSALGPSGLFEAYTADTGTWSVLPPLPTPRNGLALVAARDGRIYAIGGNDGGFGAARATVEAYSIATHSWTTMASLPAPRTGVSAVEGADGKIYVFGGQWQGDGGDYKNSVYAYDPSTNSWATRNSSGFSARYYSAAARLPDGRIGVFGGWNNLLGGHLATAEAYDPASDTWSALPSMPTLRQGPAAFAGCDGRIIVAGGADWSAQLASADLYDPASQAWSPGPTMLAAHAYAGVGVTIDGTATIVAGYTDPAGYLTSVERLDTSNGAWCGFDDGFERGTLARWTETRVSVQSATTLTGGYAATSASSGRPSYARTTLPSPRSDLYLRSWLRVASQGPKPVTLLELRTRGGELVSLIRRPDGTLATRNAASDTTRTSTTALPADDWHSLELHTRIGATGQIDVWLDGIPITALTTRAPLGTRPITTIGLGDTASGRRWNITYDDLAAAPNFLGQ